MVHNLEIMNQEATLKMDILKCDIVHPLYMGSGGYFIINALCIGYKRRSWMVDHYFTCQISHVFITKNRAPC